MTNLRKIKDWILKNRQLTIVIVCSLVSLGLCVFMGVNEGGLWEDALDKLVTALISFLGFSVTGYIFLNNMLQSRKSKNSIENEVIEDFQTEKREKLMKLIMLITGCILMSFCLKYLKTDSALIHPDMLSVVKYIVYTMCTIVSVYSIIYLGRFLYEMINYEHGLQELTIQKRKAFTETKEQEPVSKGKFLNQVNNMDIVVNRLLQNHTYAQTANIFDNALKSALCDGITDQAKICACGEFADRYKKVIEYRNLLIRDNSIKDGENVSHGATVQELLNELFKDYLQNEILTSISLSNIVLKNANLSFSSLANSSLYNIEFQENSILQKTDFRDSTLNAINFHNADCTNANFKNSKLIDIKFDTQTKLQRTIFDDADLTGLGKFGTTDKLGKELIMCYAKFKNALLSNLDIYNIDFTYADFDDAQFVDCKIGDSTIKKENVVFRFASLQNANFLRALIVRTSFEKAKLIGANLTYAKIQDTIFDETNLENAGFIETKICDVSFVKAYGADLSLKGSFIENVKFNYATLSNADLSGTTISNADFSDSICRNMLAVGMKVSDSHFVGTVFNQSRIVGEEKQNVEFYNCDFTNADFSNAAISNIVFKECEFDSADFTSSRLLNVHFEDCKSLDTVVSKQAWVNGGNTGKVLPMKEEWRHL